MRVALLFALLVLGAAQGAQAAPAVSRVNVTIGQDLAKKAQDLGTREFEILSADLKRSVQRKLPSTSGGGTLDLIIEDARPNRPTPQQLAKTPGLSYDSFGVGGARISGAYVDPAGNRTPITYDWYESDIRWARTGGTWHDAQTAFDRLADRLSRDEFVETR